LSSAALSFAAAPFLLAAGAAAAAVVLAPPAPGALPTRAELRLAPEVPSRKYLSNNG
jgi:hypothetical protein